VNLAPIVPAFESCVRPALEMGVSRMGFQGRHRRPLRGECIGFPLSGTALYALIIRSLVTLEGIALSVDPEFKNPRLRLSLLRPSAVMEDPDPDLRAQLARDASSAVTDFRLAAGWKPDSDSAVPAGAAGVEDCWISAGFPLLRQRGCLRQQLGGRLVDFRSIALGLAGVFRAGSALPKRCSPPRLRSRPVVAMRSDPLLNLTHSTPAGDPAPTAGFRGPNCAETACHDCLGPNRTCAAWASRWPKGWPNAAWYVPAVRNVLVTQEIP